MKRLVLAASVALALIGAGCDDDGDAKPTDARTDTIVGDGGGDGGGPAGRCTGTFAALTRAQLGGATSSSGKCASASDLDLICTGNLAQKARECGTSCLQAGIPTTAVPGCVSNCIAATNLSMGCSDCYRDLFTCTLAKCSACTADPNSTACMTCQVTQGCIPTFFQCSGLPGGLPTDGGVPDVSPEAGADRPADAPDAGADVPADTGTPDAGAPDSADATAG